MTAKIFICLLIVAWVLYSVLWVYALVHTHNTCHDGHVVKNIFDWPVCVH